MIERATSRWSRFIVIGLAATTSATSCKRARSSPQEARASSPPARAGAPTENVAQRARSEFQVLPSSYVVGTSKLYSRGDLLPLDDPKAMSEGDFIGRLRALFGPVAGDEYVLRDRATGFIVTAYSAQSGPSYGGGPRYRGKLPEAGSAAALTDLFKGSQARAARIRADPVLSKGRPVDWAKVDPKTISPAEFRALREKDRAWFKHFEDVAAPPGFDKVVARLDALVSAVRPADWEATRYWSDDPSVYRVGVRNGVAFEEQLSAAKGLDYLLAQAEQRRQPIKDTASGPLLGPDWRVVEYWTYNARHGAPVDRALPRVRAAWFRFVHQIKKQPKSLRKLLVGRAREQIGPLKLDPGKARAALRDAR